MLSGAGSVVVLMVTALKTQKHYSVSEMNLGVQVCPLVQYLSTMMFLLKGLVAFSCPGLWLGRWLSKSTLMMFH